MALMTIEPEFNQSPKLYLLKIKLKGNDIQSETILIVERKEEYKKDHNGSIVSGSLIFSYELIGNKTPSSWRSTGSFHASYYKRYDGKEEVSLSSSMPGSARGAIHIGIPHLEGNRVGTYFLSRIIEWVTRWPSAKVTPILLSEKDATPDNKERRNRYYEQFNIQFDYHTSTRDSGISRAMQVKDLVNVDTWKQNIFEIKISDHMNTIENKIYENTFTIQELSNTIHRLKEELSKYYSHPFIFGFKLLYYRFQNIILLGLIILFMYFINSR